MVSSMKNSLHRRTHKERGQPLERQKFGVLEKRKDYLERAKNYHTKQKRIQKLKEKASQRNKDEFYYGMTHQRTNRGIHPQYRETPSLSTDIEAVLKAQDTNYMRTMRRANVKKIESLKKEVTQLADLINPKAFSLNEDDESDDGAADILDDLDAKEIETLRNAGILPPALSTEDDKRKSGTMSAHIVFVENEAAAWSYEPPNASSSKVSAELDQEEDVEEVDLGWIVPEPMQEADKGTNTTSEGTLSEPEAEEARKHRSKLLKELAARLERDKHLRYADQELHMQKQTAEGKKQGKQRWTREREQVVENDQDDEEFTFRRKNRMPVVELGNEVYKPTVTKWKPMRQK